MAAVRVANDAWSGGVSVDDKVEDIGKLGMGCFCSNFVKVSSVGAAFPALEGRLAAREISSCSGSPYSKDKSGSRSWRHRV